MTQDLLCNVLFCAFSLQTERIKETIQTGGTTGMDEGETEKMVAEEEEEEGSEEEARAGQPLCPASQPALSPKVKGPQSEAGRLTETTRLPAAGQLLMKGWITAAMLHCRGCKLENDFRTGELKGKCRWKSHNDYCACHGPIRCSILSKRLLLKNLHAASF